MEILIIGSDNRAQTLSKLLSSKGITAPYFEINHIDNQIVKNAQILISINSASSAIKVLKDLIPHITQKSVYVDANSAPPSLKRTLSDLLGNHNFVDAAILTADSCPQSADDVLISGAGAKSLNELLAPMGIAFKYISDKPGDSAARKMIQVMLTQGLAAAAIETLWLAENLGLEQWALAEIQKVFNSSSESTIEYYLKEIQKHPKNRQVEMGDIISLLNDSSHESAMTAPIELVLSKIIHAKKIPLIEE